MYCANCGEEVKLKRWYVNAYVGDINVGKYPMLNLVCSKCGCVTGCNTVDKRNKELERMFWRDYYDIIPTKEILQIPKKYRISRKLIDEILCIKPKGIFGEKSIWMGELPNSAEDERLKRALNDPQYMLEAAEKSTISEHDKERVRKRVCKLLENA